MTEEKKKKKRVNSKAKGSGFEGVVSKLLSAALAPLNFKRSQQSGAIVGGKNFAEIGHAFSKEALSLFVGDVVPMNEAEVKVHSKFVYECKFYKEVERIDALFKNSKIYGWLEEARTDAVKIDRQPMLIFKWNNTPIFVAVDSYLTPLPKSVKYIQLVDGKTHVALFEDLLKHPEFFIQENVLWNGNPPTLEIVVVPELSAAERHRQIFDDEQ